MSSSLLIFPVVRLRQGHRACGRIGACICPARVRLTRRRGWPKGVGREEAERMTGRRKVRGCRCPFCFLWAWLGGAQERDRGARSGAPRSRGTLGNHGVELWGAARGPGQPRGVVREVAASQALALRAGGVRAGCGGWLASAGLT